MLNQLPNSLQLKVRYEPLSNLKPYANNARRHPRSQIKVIKRSIERFGFLVPLIVDANGIILCGHGRYEAAQQLGMDTVPVIVLDHLSEEDRRAYILMDNAAAETAGWNKQLVRTELQGLIELGYDVELTGFTTLQIDNFLNIGESIEHQDEPAVELPGAGAPVVSRIDDLWAIGKHRLLCGDACLASSYERLLSGELAQMTFADPPYNVRIAGNVSGLGHRKHGEFVAGSGELTDGAFELQLLRPAFRNIAKYSGPGAIGFFCMDWRGGRILQDAAEGVFAELKNLIVWVKTNAGMGSFYRSQHELIYTYKINAGSHINNFGLGGGGRMRSNVWTYPGANTFRKGRDEDLADHPTVKNRQMVADAIMDCSKPGGIVLDPFLGSGTTLIAAEMTSRRGYGMELDPAYCDVILRRIQAETCLVPMLDGQTFAEVAAGRLGEASRG